MADAINVKGNSDAKFKNHPAGQYTAQCVDTINLGERVISFLGKPTEVRGKCALVFRTGEKNPDTGVIIDVSHEFTISMFETANLRQFLEQWRGKSYSPEQADEGVQLEKLVGHWALISVEEKQSKKNRTYAIIKSIAPLPNAMPRPTFLPYTREEYWGERKVEYAAEVKAYRDALAQSAPQDFAAAAASVQDGADGSSSVDDLPF